jgi:hypothetical protein
MAPVLGWAEERIAWELDLYRRRGEAEMTNQSPPDDEEQRGTLAVRGKTLS